MKITRLEILKVPPSWVWLKVHTDEGLCGLGEPFLEDHPHAVIAEVQRLEPLLIGQDPRRIEWLWQRMYRAGNGYRGGMITLSAISGIDLALWDIAGKAAGLSVAQMIGGVTHERVPIYRSVAGVAPYCVEPGKPYRAPGKPINDRLDLPDAWADSARTLAEEWGYRCLKMHFNPGESLDGGALIPRMVACVAAVREAVGETFDLAIDIHNPHPSIARQMIDAFTPYHPLFIEEPIPSERIEVLRQVTEQSRAPIAAGERWMGKWAFAQALSDGGLAVVQPDICHAGGITECRKIAALAEAAHARVALHCPLSPLALAACLQLDATLPNLLVQEHNEVLDGRDGGHTTIGAGYLAEPFVLEGGAVTVPMKPGLGVEIDEAGLARIMQQTWSEARG